MAPKRVVNRDTAEAAVKAARWWHNLTGHERLALEGGPYEPLTRALADLHAALEADDGPREVQEEQLPGMGIARCCDGVGIGGHLHHPSCRILQMSVQVEELHSATFAGPPLPELVAGHRMNYPVQTTHPAEYLRLEVENLDRQTVAVRLMDADGRHLRRILWGRA